jgi:TonB family protein
MTKPIMRTTSVFLLLAVLGCRTAYLPATALQRRAPVCGAHPIGPGSRGSPTFFACQVDQPVRSPLNGPLAYPPLLAQSNVEGVVALQFVVDERGTVDSTTVVVLGSTHDIFTRAARNALAAWRVQPALRRGVPVRQLTTHAFCFRLLQYVKFDGACAEPLTRFPPSAVSFACEDGVTSWMSDHRGSGFIIPPPRPGSRCPRS